MFTFIRFKLAGILADMAEREFGKGTLKGITKGCKYFSWSIRIVPKTEAVKQILAQCEKKVENN